MRIKNGVGTSEDLDKALVRAGEQTQFAANIISRIRDYTYRKLPEFAPIHIVELIDSCVSLLDWEIQRQSIDLEPRYRLYPDSENIVVVGDETMLQQVIVNLMRNAMDAMQNNQQQRLLVIDYQLVSGAIELIIRDSGVGLDDDAKDKLFVPFVSTKPTGMGVGLNICRSFIELHQGKLWLSANEEPSRGCSAFIRLNLQLGQQQSAAS
jgi:signal transduction histidine kinase